MQTIRTSAVAIGLAAMCAAGLTAQTQDSKSTTETKVEIKGGKDMKVIGCLERLPNGDYSLSGAREHSRDEATRYELVTNKDLSKHVGERVEVHGRSVANGHGKVSVETKTTTEVENGKDQETKTKSEATSGALDMKFLGVKSMKMLATSCN